MIGVNLHDTAFAHIPDCSVPGKYPQRVRWVRGRMKWDGITVFTDAMLSETNLPRLVESRFKIGWLMEPIEYRSRQYDVALGLLDVLDLLLTHDRRWIEEHPHPKIRWVPFGGCWIPREKWGLAPTKTGRICQVMSGKDWMPGHRLRHEIARRFPQVDCYGWGSMRGRLTMEQRTEVLRQYQFCVVVENSRRRGFFTEKLLDCFAVATKPIYWGAPDIANEFGDFAVLPFSSLDDLGGILARLPTEPALPHRNLEEYEIPEDWIALNVLEPFLEKLP